MFTDFLSPIDNPAISGNDAYLPNSIGSFIKAYYSDKNFPDLKKTDLAIIGVEEERRAVHNDGCAAAPDTVRKYLYRLYRGDYEMKVADLGNIRQGNTIEDTYFALRSVVHELLKKNIIPVVIGGSQDLTYASYLAYENIEETINIVSVDSSFDIGAIEDEFSSRTWMGKIILHQPNHLFNYSNIGYQTYFTDPDQINLMSKLFFDAHRLGQVRTKIDEVEPVIRNADLASFDVSCIRNSDAPGCGHASPNGFYGEEACQIARYAGMSDKLSAVGFYELNPALDKKGHTAHLTAQMIWCFADGYYSRKKDFPFKKTTDVIKYRVSIKDLKDEIIFYKSKKSDRWWMEVPYPEKKNKFTRHLLVPCTYNAYETALREEMPDQWWQTYQKLG